MYCCVACGQELFSSDTKFDPCTGWLSFWDAVDQKKSKKSEDKSLGMVRTEVVCVNCGVHLGHVLDDELDPTGKRYCINSLALDFKSPK